jgi:hypothetical protein
MTEALAAQGARSEFYECSKRSRAGSIGVPRCDDILEKALNTPPSFFQPDFASPPVRNHGK